MALHSCMSDSSSSRVVTQRPRSEIDCGSVEQDRPGESGSPRHTDSAEGLISLYLEESHWLCDTLLCVLCTFWQEKGPGGKAGSGAV